MLYAKVVLGLAVRGPFDYIVPPQFLPKIKPGSRVRVDFCRRKVTGYVVGISKKTNVKNLKPLLELIDVSPVLDKNMLTLTRRLSDYYCCSWGEAIETCLPETLRKGRRISASYAAAPAGNNRQEKSALLVHDLDGRARWGIYLEEIRGVLEKGRSSIVILPDIDCAHLAKETIDAGLKVNSILLYRKQPRELEAWLSVRSARSQVVVGTRSAIFAPLNNLGLIIIDEEQDSVYKQDQVPHYHCREAAFMRAQLAKAKVILGACAPSLESYYLAKKNRIKYVFLPKKTAFPEVKIIDSGRLPFAERKHKAIFSKLLQDAIFEALNSKTKVLLFLNRKGFASQSTCHNCGANLKCPRCSVNLVYHFADNVLSCHYCSFRMELPKICPHCNSGYIKFSGLGAEKIESEISRIFPQARIAEFDPEIITQSPDVDIFVATSAILRHPGYSFGLIGVLGVDNSLNRIDFRASEKTSAILAGLLKLTEGKVIIQTRLPRHHSLRALQNKEPDLFYGEELKQRKQLGFPPYRHIIMVKLRGKKEERAAQVSQALFGKLCLDNKDKGIKVLSVNAAQPVKLRGNFYWQVLVSCANVIKANDLIKKSLKDLAHSGIIVTVDVDPL